LNYEKKNLQKQFEQQSKIQQQSRKQLQLLHQEHNEDNLSVQIQSPSPIFEFDDDIKRLNHSNKSNDNTDSENLKQRTTPGSKVKSDETKKKDEEEFLENVVNLLVTF